MARTVIRASQVKEDTLEDADGNTKILVEESADENKIRFDTAGSERMIITHDGKVGIGTSTPSTSLHIASTGDAAIFLEADTDNSGETDNAYIKFSQDNGLITALLGTVGDAGKDPENNVYTGAIANTTLLGTTTNYPLQFGTSDNVRMTILNDGKVGIGTTAPAVNLDVTGTGKFSTAVQTALIEYTNGDDAITIETGGYLKFHAGVKYSRGVRVSTGLTPINSQNAKWIKIASTQIDGQQYDTSCSSFLVTMAGRETTTSRRIDGIFLVHVKYTADTSGAGDGGSGQYYWTTGTWVVVEPLHADWLSSVDGSYPYADFDPATDIFLTIQNDSTPSAEIWMKVPAKQKEIFVTHLGGTGVNDLYELNPGFVIQSGQAWADPEPGGLVHKIYGKWASKVFSNVTIKDVLVVKDTLETKAMKVNVRDVNSTSTIQATDHTLRCIQNADITLTLPAKASSAGRVLVFKDALGNAGPNPSDHNITIDGDSNDQIDGSATYVINAPKESVTLTCDGINGWMITSRVVP